MQYGLFQWSIFALFTVQRAAHNSLLEFAKQGKKDFPYPAASIVWASQFWGFLLCAVLAYFSHGAAAFKKCFSPSGMVYWFFAALINAIGDILEMEANRYVDSATYTVLNQGKVIITAVMMMYLMGKKQTQLQWVLLMLLTFGMCEYIIVQGKAAISPNGIGLALAKVVISCYSAVQCEGLMKNDPKKTPFLVGFGQMRMVQFILMSLYFFIKDREVLAANGWNPLHGWEWRAYTLLFLGFVFKGILTRYLTVIMDSLLKNISEVASVILVYYNQIIFMGASFKMDNCVAAIIIMTAMYAYVLTKESNAPKKETKIEKISSKIDAKNPKQQKLLADAETQGSILCEETRVSLGACAHACTCARKDSDCSSEGDVCVRVSVRNSVRDIATASGNIEDTESGSEDSINYRDAYVPPTHAHDVYVSLPDGPACERYTSAAAPKL